MYRKELQEVEDKFNTMLDYQSIGKFNLKEYIGTSLQFKGMTIPEARSIFNIGYSFSNISAIDQLKIWSYIWNHSQLYEVKHQALFCVDKLHKKLDSKEVWEVLKTWVTQLDNWAHSDGLSNYYSHLLEKEETLVYHQLKIWNRSESSWERRQSIVSLLYYQRHRKKFLSFQKYIILIKNLLNDSDYFVQKGVGWSLREVYQVYEVETFDFMMKHASKITAIAYYAASEKLSEAQKNDFKLIRKKLRISAK